MTKTEFNNVADDHLGRMVLLSAALEGYFHEYHEFCQEHYPEYSTVLYNEISFILMAHRKLKDKVSPIVNQKNNKRFLEKYEALKDKLDQHFQPLQNK